jgi:hypothetical protein
MFGTAGPALAAPCDQLAALALKDAAVTSATRVAAGQFVPPGRADAATARSFKALPAFCRVAATLKPSSDSDIKVEVWLPASGWNGKFQAATADGQASSVMPRWRKRCVPGMRPRRRTPGTSAAAARSRWGIQRS